MLPGAGRCRGSTVRAAGQGPTAELVAAEHPLLGAGLPSSRRAPPKAASNLFSRMPRSSVTVCNGLRDGPLSTTRPASMSSCTLATTRRRPIALDQGVAGGDDLVEVVTGVDVHDGERQPAWANALMARCSMTIESLPPEKQQHRPLELGGHLADDVDGLGLERAQMAQLVLAGGRLAYRGSGHGFPVKLVRFTRLRCITRYITSSGVLRQPSSWPPRARKRARLCIPRPWNAQGCTLTAKLELTSSSLPVATSKMNPRSDSCW